MVFEYQSHYDKGYVVEYLDSNDTSKRCEGFILLPAENLWHEGVRGFLYLLAMLYLFLGVAVASDIFMNSIEVMTSKKRTIKRVDPDNPEKVVTIEVLVWNETVANLTLMALGSSAPEILLAVIEQILVLGEDQGDSLGTFTIIGSAAFNLFVITSICIVSVPAPDVKFIKEFGVFLTTTFYSVFAYVWMLLVVQVISPGEIEWWEAWVTIAFMPLFVLHSYAQDSGWWCHKCCKGASVSDETGDKPAIRVFTHHARKGSITGHAVPGQELHMLEAAHRNKAHQLSDHTDTESIDSKHGVSKHGDTKVFARARFRHAVVSAMTGHKPTKRHGSAGKTRMSDIVSAVQGIQDVSKKGVMPSYDQLYGKFTFSSQVYEVLESKGLLEIDVLFHRKIPVGRSSGGLQIMGILNGQTVMMNETIVDQKFKDVSVEYETREGSAKAGSKFKYTSGTLKFAENEYKKTVTIPIIQDNQYTGNADFFILLKNPSSGAGIGDPSVGRVNIVDDDAPGEFQFKDSHVFAKDGKISVKIIREKGYDGKVTLEYSTHDVTAVGGESLKEKDYVAVDHSLIEFKHQEKSKTIDIKVNKEAKFEHGQGSKSFIVTIKNPSVGAKVGKTATVVCHINKESLDDRIAGVVADMEEEEDMTWGGQFYNAFTIGGEKDEEGNDIRPKWHEFLLHFLTFFWKVVGACIPPTKYLGAWPAFVLSLLYIGVLTLFIQQLAGLLGCVIGLETSVTGITLIALGTSLPDTFASRTAAKQDEHADAAIGNITGSNSVNVFLGLGLPWVLATMYGIHVDKPYKVKTGNLTVSVIIFCVLAVICIATLILRRKLVGGELGGKNAIVKWLTMSSLGNKISIWNKCTILDKILIIGASLNQYVLKFTVCITLDSSNSNGFRYDLNFLDKPKAPIRHKTDINSIQNILQIVVAECHKTDSKSSNDAIKSSKVFPPNYSGNDSGTLRVGYYSSNLVTFPETELVAPENHHLSRDQPHSQSEIQFIIKQDDSLIEESATVPKKWTGN
ncbi:SLC8A [Mytilus coruscus]|uniref:SLC8A n=1 Tax=Mytilus coruscus TaxID=42192 RepID=A0A6J8DVX7_MYTCO|nr:SLC8A [Mytilus coruscus]